MIKNYGIILASGNGSRYGSDVPKQFIKILSFAHILNISISVMANGKKF